MTSIRRSASSSSLASCLIIASESGEIIILDPQTFAVLHHVSPYSQFTTFIPDNNSTYFLNRLVRVHSRQRPV